MFLQTKTEKFENTKPIKIYAPKWHAYSIPSRADNKNFPCWQQEIIHVEITEP